MMPLELSTTPPTDHFGHKIDASVSAAKAKRFGCHNCGERGHHSSGCPKPKKKSLTAQACAGATSTVPLGYYGPKDNNDDNNSFDEEIDVVWG
jgi:hypothetical protein